MKKDTLVVGFVYPGVEPYMEDYLKSIWGQTYKNFDLFLGDGRNPIESRREVIWHAWENYKYIVWTDCDDWFSPKRVEMSREGLKKCDFVYNTLNIWDTDCHSSLDWNIFGFSNTAVRAEILRDIQIPPDIQALDWWLYYVLGAKRGHSFKKVDGITYYRQTKDNLGWKKPLTWERLKHGIHVKTSHYTGSELFGKMEEMFHLRKKLEDTKFRAKYIKVINKNMDKIYKGWWSEILPLHEWEKYNE